MADSIRKGALAAANDTVQEAVGASAACAIQVSGTFAGTITFEASSDFGQVWTAVAVSNAATSVLGTTTTAVGMFLLANAGYTHVRAKMTSYTSGTASVAIRGGFIAAAAAALAAIGNFWSRTGTTITTTTANDTVDLTGSSVTAGTFASPTLTTPTLASPVLTAPNGATSTGVMITKSVLFSEDATSTSHTGTVAIPAGAIVHNISINAGALWNPTTSATLKVGDTASDNGYFTGVNLKATDLLVGEVLSTTNSTLWGGKEGAYLVAATGQRGPVTTNFGQYYAAGSNILGTITVVAPNATAGRTIMSVTYSVGAAIAPVKA